MPEDDLKNRIETLERKLGDLEYKTSHPWLLLFVVAGVVALTFMQVKIDYHFKDRIDNINRVEASHAQ